jgi:hypothetical protein
MKSEQRHKLEENTLANKTGEAIQSVKPIAPIIIGAALLLLLGVFVYAFFSSRTNQLRAEASTSLYFGQSDPDALESVYRKFPSTPAAEWARQVKADSKLGEVAQSWFYDRNQANDLATEALEEYDAILASTKSDDLKVRATLGAAKAQDFLGDRDAAMQRYEELLAMDSISEALRNQVQTSVDFLGREQGKQFFAWYDTFEPSESPNLGIPGNVNTLPTSPDFEMPDLPFGMPTMPMGSSESTATEPVGDPGGAGLTAPPPVTADESIDASDAAAMEAAGAAMTAPPTESGETTPAKADAEPVGSAPASTSGRPPRIEAPKGSSN